jgi:hypothetical protein
MRTGRLAATIPVPTVVANRVREATLQATNIIDRMSRLLSALSTANSGLRTPAMMGYLTAITALVGRWLRCRCCGAATGGGGAAGAATHVARAAVRVALSGATQAGTAGTAAARCGHLRCRGGGQPGCPRRTGRTVRYRFGCPCRCGHPCLTRWTGSVPGAAVGPGNDGADDVGAVDGRIKHGTVAVTGRATAVADGWAALRAVVPGIVGGRRRVRRRRYPRVGCSGARRCGRPGRVPGR